MSKINKLTSWLVPSLVLAVPFLASAQTTIEGLLRGTVSNIVALSIRLIMGIGLIVFFWGLVQYLSATGDEEKRASARSVMIYGVIIFFVMVGVWGLVEILQASFGVSPRTPAAPDIPL